MKKLLIIACFSLAYGALSLDDTSNQNNHIAKNRQKERSEYIWRYIEHVGWRKFTPLGASIRDWDETKRVNRHRWPWY